MKTQAIVVTQRNGSKTAYSAEMVQSILDACGTELAMNFDIPSAHILARYASKLGVSAKELRKMLADSIS